MHHSSQPDPEMSRAMQDRLNEQAEAMREAFELREAKLNTLRNSEYAPNLGATGRFPQGQLTERDEGEIAFRVGVIDRKVVLDFGQEVVWMGMDAAQARSLARALLKHADHAS
jgi:hypothetical protein